MSRDFEAPFGRGTNYAGDRLLCRSPRFTVRGRWEVALLEGRELAAPTVVGDFYGDPADAAIDAGERWCAVVGCGLIVYRLSPPWKPYTYDQVEAQWWEYGRAPEAILWLSEVGAVEDGVFVVRSRLNVSPQVVEYRVDAEHEQITPLP